VPKRTLDGLSWDECFDLLEQETVGRLVYADDDGPAAVPVNYVIANQNIVFRSEKGSKIEALRAGPVAFEVDHIDAADRCGWSVLVRGTADLVDIEQVPALIRRSNGSVPVPWKKGVHAIWVTIRPTTVTGRRLSDLAFDEIF
jgi:uncharacterized protein